MIGLIENVLPVKMTFKNLFKVRAHIFKSNNQWAFVDLI